MSLIGSLATLGSIAQNTSGHSTRIAVQVSLPTRHASPTDLTDALLDKLGFTKADLAAYREQHGVDLRQGFIDRFTKEGHPDASTTRRRIATATAATPRTSDLTRRDTNA